MHARIRSLGVVLGAAVILSAQVPSELDLQALKQVAASQAGSVATPDAVPSRSVALAPVGYAQGPLASPEDERIDKEIRALKRRERGPVRFASDLFAVRQKGSYATDGGIAEDYVLGTGDQLAVNVFGSATFDIPAQVDGRGQVVIPKVGAVQVGGLTLAQARKAVQDLVGRSFSRSTVNLQVTQLREIRVFVMGEVYRPGAYLAPSLSSLINVLSLAGGPTAVGSYRDIRVMRGGKPVYRFDLYPYRAEGLGNPNVVLQSGDTIFVPLAQAQVLLEGAFQRVAGQLPAPAPAGQDETYAESDPLKKQLGELNTRKRDLEAQLAATHAAPPVASLPPGVPVSAQTLAQAQAAPALSTKARAALEAQIQALDDEIQALQSQTASDHRLQLDPATGLPFRRPDPSTPDWLRRWDDQGIAPTMAFEMRPGETAADALRYAGGFALEAGAGTLTLRHRSLSGVITGQDVPPDQAAKVLLQRGDVLSALPQREVTGAVVHVVGWARVPGTYARTAGLRVGDLLKRENQILPDTYHPRGEIVRTLPDGSTSYLAFDVDKALAGDPAADLVLADRDRIELYHVEDFRRPETVTVLGPVSRPGVYAFHRGMRVSDLIFRTGLPLQSANELVAELAHHAPGQPDQVVRLDLSRLLSTETASPVNLDDDAVNPPLRPDDQLSFFQVPNFKVHRTVQVLGQVARPGAYTLDSEHTTLRQILQRAGGLTSDAMPEAGVFLRRIGRTDAALHAAAQGSGISPSDPTAKGINDILERLNETKREPHTGALLTNDVMHGLMAGNLNRMVVDFREALKGNAQADVELEDGDEIIIPLAMDSAYVVGETASPFANYKVAAGMKVRDLLKLAGGTTRNADTWNIRLLKADGRIVDNWVMRQPVGPGDTVLVPQRFRRDSSWQENLAALTPIAVMLNVLKL